MAIPYEIHYSYRRSISVQITKDCIVRVKAPYGVSKEKVLSFLQEKRSWISKHMEKQEELVRQVLKLGKYTKQEIADARGKAKIIIPERVNYYAKIGNFSYNRIFIKLQKTRWGSCSVDKNLNFNCLLVLMPPEVLDSVVVHELCHLHHMNHSREFYKEIYKIFPDYDKWDKWLKDNGGVFLRRVV